MDTGFVAGRHGPFDNRVGTGTGFSTVVTWNTTAYPVVITSHAGLYRCRTDTVISGEAYQLNVLRKILFNSNCYSMFSLIWLNFLIKLLEFDTLVEVRLGRKSQGYLEYSLRVR